MRDKFVSIMSGLLLVLLISATAVPRLHTVSVDEVASNDTLGNVITRRVSINYGVFLVDRCSDGSCSRSRQRCVDQTGSACDTSWANRCKTIKAFAVIGIFCGAFAMWASGVQAAYDPEEHPDLFVLASDPATAGAFLGGALSSLIVFSIWSDYHRGDDSNSEGCGLDGKGDLGISFIFFVIDFIGYTAFALLYLHRVYDSDGAVYPSQSR